MAKIQSRKSLSVAGDLYDRFAEHCSSRGISKSQAVAAAIEKILAGDLELPAAVPTHEVAFATMARRRAS